MVVSVDGVPQQTFTEPAAVEGAYTLRSINVTAFANNAPHAILFAYNGPTTGTASFVIDDVELVSCTALPVELLAFSIAD